MTHDVAMNELVLPTDPLNEAVYSLLFATDSKKLKDSLLFRITDYLQSFMGIMGRSSVNKIMQELRDAYDAREHAKEKVNITIPKRGGERWWATENPTYKGTKEIEVHLIRPEGVFSLAREFENVFRKYDAIEMLEELGKKDVLSNVGRLAVEIETFV